MQEILWKTGIYFIATGIFNSIFQILWELSRIRKKQTINNHLFLVIVVLSVQTRLFLLLQQEEIPAVFFFGFFSSLFFSGPVYYLNIRSAFSLNKKINLLHFVFPGVVFAADMILLQFPELKLFTWSNGQFVPSFIFQILIFFVAFNFCIYSLLSFRFYWKEKKRYRQDYNLSIAQFLIIPFLLTLTGLVGFFIDSRGIIFVAGIIITTGGFLVQFFLMRYEDFFNAMNFEIIQKRYLKTPLDRLEIPTLKLRLEKILLEEKPFKHENLRIQYLAKQLQINTNQLSRILNEEYGKNFYRFINFYRIEAAKELLVLGNNFNTLQIGLEVGYGSKSAFYKNFQEETGITPVEYRKKFRSLKNY
ncbi:MAG: helix-turn-helix domain-containing protein [Leptospira sp.]|nr:helix-turn-helix domain-containing protein [Leptospira sp.]